VALAHNDIAVFRNVQAYRFQFHVYVPI
jgi:hypothetical protein